MIGTGQDALPTEVRPPGLVSDGRHVCLLQQKETEIKPNEWRVTNL